MIRVVAAVIHNDRGEVLIARRPEHKHQGGLWEFPGGKVEEGESADHALVRELGEELGITPSLYRPLLTVEHHYPDKAVRLEVWRVTAFTGEAHGAEGQPVSWVPVRQLAEFDFPEANAPIIKAAGLPLHYAITPDPSEVGGDLPAWLRPRLEAGQWLLLRAKSHSPSEYGRLAAEVAALCAGEGVHLMLHDRPELLATLPAQGVHLTSRMLADLPEDWRRRDAGLDARHYLACSAHGAEELAKAWRLGADFATLSPVKATRSHPGVAGMGWQRWGELARNAGIPVYALGGMRLEDMEPAHAAGGQGIAGISGLFQD